MPAPVHRRAPRVALLIETIEKVHDRLNPALKLDGILAKQREQLRGRFGDAAFTFRVAVEDGKAKLKATRAKA